MGRTTRSRLRTTQRSIPTAPHPTSSFQPSSPPRTRTIMTRATDDEDDDDEKAEREALQVIALFCETAILVEQEVLALGKGHATQNRTRHRSTVPMFFADLFRVQTAGPAPRVAHATAHPVVPDDMEIAPLTGGVPYWATSSILCGRAHDASSPLDILLREDRVRHSTNCQAAARQQTKTTTARYTRRRQQPSRTSLAPSPPFVVTATMDPNLVRNNPTLL